MCCAEALDQQRLKIAERHPAIETRLGLKREGRLLFDERAFDDRLSATDRARLADTEKKPKLVEQLDLRRERVPEEAGDAQRDVHPRPLEQIGRQNLDPCDPTRRRVPDRPCA